MGAYKPSVKIYLCEVISEKMKLEQWRIFAVLADSKNLVRAAERLGKTPSGVSMSLRQLERDIGGRLFESDRKTHLTDLGRLVLKEARRNLASFDASVQTIRDHVEAEGQTLRIGAVPSAMQHLLPPLLAEFQRLYPDVHLEIRDQDSNALQDALDTQRLDLVVRSHERPVDNPWVNDRLGWVLPRSHPFAEHDHLTLAQVVDTALISNQLCQRSEHQDLQALDRASSTRVFSTPSLLTLIRQGVGITVLPELTVRGDPELTFVPIAPARFRYLKLHTQSKPSQACQDFTDLAFDERFSGVGLSHQIS